ncbi:type IV pilus assembly protein FimV [Pleionea sediminis]|uniref:type IV pilus assembly protein FimV n=1 Tax=Pleionea sediminis TaxID=2569479 RepID=UPI001185889A|nr:hypothetical protein [Pleionea sediminis]
MLSLLRPVVVAMSVAGVTHSFAIGLGEPQNNGFMNERLNVDLKLLGNPLDFESIKIKLANEQMHEKFGINFPDHLPRIDGRVVNDNGNYYVELTSLTRIKEPYVDAIIEVKYRNGIFYKQLTFFLDPKSIALNSRPAKTIESNSRSSVPTVNTIPAKELLKKARSQNTAANVTSRKEEPVIIDSGKSIVVQRGDSLWKIASRWSSDLSMHKKMDVLFKNNQHAFLSGDRNKLLEGAKITVPQNYGVTESTKVASHSSDVKSSTSEKIEINQSMAAQSAAVTSLREELMEQQQRLDAMEQANRELRAQLQVAEQNVTSQQSELMPEVGKVELAQNVEMDVKPVESENTSLSSVFASETPVTLSIQPPVVSDDVVTDKVVTDDVVAKESTELTGQLSSTQGDNAIETSGGEFLNLDKSVVASALAIAKNNLWATFISGLLLGGLLFAFIGTRVSRFYTNRSLKKIQDVFDAAELKHEKKKFMRVPDLNDLPLPKIHSIPMQMAELRAAANLYIEHHRYDLAKAVVNSRLIQYAGNSQFVAQLEALRAEIQVAIDEHVKEDLDCKLKTDSRSVVQRSMEVTETDQNGPISLEQWKKIS